MPSAGAPPHCRGQNRAWPRARARQHGDGGKAAHGPKPVHMTTDVMPIVRRKHVTFWIAAASGSRITIDLRALTRGYDKDAIRRLTGFPSSAMVDKPSVPRTVGAPCPIRFSIPPRPAATELLRRIGSRSSFSAAALSDHAALSRSCTPISTPMLWRYLTGQRVERIVRPLDAISPAVPHGGDRGRGSALLRAWRDRLDRIAQGD